jgi:hypothetical protein
VLGVAKSGEPKERVDRRQARVPGAHAVSALALEMVEEGGDKRRVEIGAIEPGGLAPGAFGGKRKEQPPGVAVGGHRARARALLAHEPLGEERLERRRERAHGRPPRLRSRRLLAKPRSLGAP